jgi:type II secretory pathway component PulM
MMTWFNAREPRERVLLMILAGLVIIFAAWFALTREGGSNGAEQLEAAQLDRELWLRAAPRLGVAGNVDAKSEFTRGALVDTARKRGVALSRVQPNPSGGLTVWIDDAPTPALYALISDIVMGHDVEVETALMTTAPNGGVNAQLTLTPL